jgi:TadE-like protein
MQNLRLTAAGRAGGRNGPDRQAGVSTVEFAIVSPFALLVVLGLIQIGLMFTAKEVVNEGAFLAARAGAVQNAQLNTPDQTGIQDVMVKALIPFYQDTTITNDQTRLNDALGKANDDAAFIHVEVLNPTPAAFADFGITSSASGGHTYIPNDNLEYRSHTYKGSTSHYSIQDANALKIKVTYGYQLKVPLMQTVLSLIMCGVMPQGSPSGQEIAAFGQGYTTATASDSTQGSDCTNYYTQGRVPLVTYATVQMQTPAWKPDN